MHFSFFKWFLASLMSLINRNTKLSLNVYNPHSSLLPIKCYSEMRLCKLIETTSDVKYYRKMHSPTK